jgi:c-di-GMP-binding flagellar brake protein YcgR
MHYESGFLIHSPEKIIRKLFILLKKKCLLTVYYGDNDDSFITTLLDINIKDNRLIFYHSPKQGSIKEFLDSPVITFKTEYLGVKVVFNSIKLAKIQHEGVSVFAIPIPDSLLWIEARNYYRVKALSFAPPSYCQLALKPDQTPIKLKLYDISIAGFSILIDSAEVSNLMVPETHFVQCQIILTDIGEEGTVSFKVKSKYLINPEDPLRVDKVGCKFTKITTVFENTIHRYMGQIERKTRQES